MTTVDIGKKKHAHKDWGMVLKLETTSFYRHPNLTNGLFLEQWFSTLAAH